jgi:SAM-dependent methyltransferase
LDGQKGIVPRDTDGYGHVIEQHYRGRATVEIVERDDGWFGVSEGAAAYFAKFEDWPAQQRRAIRYASGRVLDVGCGAGRVALYLQDRGHDVVAIDVSPGAVRTCRMRGVKKAQLLSITTVGRRLGEFDTIVMFGNNFGLFANPQRARWLLKRFHCSTSTNAKLLAESRNPYATTLPEHRRYHRFNRQRGRMPGQLRLRIHSGHACTPWFDYLLVSPAEMHKIVAGTGWRVARLVHSEDSVYVAVLEKVAP